MRLQSFGVPVRYRETDKKFGIDWLNRMHFCTYALITGSRPRRLSLTERS